MPRIFRFGEYWIYFWTNENKPLEPVHIHVAKGAPTANATKIWITSTGIACFVIIIPTFQIIPFAILCV